MRAKIADIRQAVERALWLVPGHLRVSERDTPTGPTYNFLEAFDAEIIDSVELDLHLLKALDYSKGVLLDLYVYERVGRFGEDGDLITNVTVVIDSDGAVLTAYDSVTHRGVEYDKWWIGR